MRLCKPGYLSASLLQGMQENSAKMAKAGIVTTLRLPDGMSQPLRSFLDYHLAVGFEHIFLFFDDSDDKSIGIAERYASQYVSVFRRSEALVRWQADATSNAYLLITVAVDDGQLREQAQRCSQYTKLAPYIEEVPARQTLNAELAMILAEERGLTWLLHIDMDELFYTDAADVSSHFSWLDEQGVLSMMYMNHEAVPETREIVDYFQEVTLFRRHFSALPMDGATREAMDFWRSRTNHGQYFLVYDNGKSACRVGVGAYPKDVHTWQLPTEHSSQERTAIADARRLDPTKLLLVKDPCILHFVTCGLSWFLEKYKMLGDFESAWFGGRLPIAPSFHLDARDAVHHNEKANLSAEALYGSQVLLSPSENAEIAAQHLAAGVLFRNLRHTQVIAGCRAAEYDVQLLREVSRTCALSKPPSDVTTSSESTSKIRSVVPAAPATTTPEAQGFDRAWIIAQVTQQYLVDR